jgi:hypothetical protein
MLQTRRGLLFGIGASLIAAPAIVRAASLMPVRGIVQPVGSYSGYWSDIAIQYREEFIRSFEQRQSLLTSRIVREAVVPEDQIAFLVAPSQWH